MNRITKYIRDGIIGLGAITSLGCATTNEIPITSQSPEYKLFERYLARGNRTLDELLFSETITEEDQVFRLRDSIKADADSASAIYDRLPEKSPRDYARVNDLLGNVYLISGNFGAAGGFYMQAADSLSGQEQREYVNRVLDRYNEILPSSSGSDYDLIIKSMNLFNKRYGSEKVGK